MSSDLALPVAVEQAPLGHFAAPKRPAGAPMGALGRHILRFGQGKLLSSQLSSVSHIYCFGDFRKGDLDGGC